MPPVITHFTLPVLAVLMFVELFHSWQEKKELYSSADTLSNIVVGLSAFAFNLFSKYLGFYLMVWLHSFSIVSFPSVWWVWILAFLANEITFYIYHRCCHEVNWFWASHVVHHSSEHMNISVAFRQSFTSSLSGHFIFWLWMPLLGFSPFMTLMATQLCLFYQSFLHTETVRKFPRWIEFIFNTPSHHRVHHSSNPEYLDKNHGGMLILWDRLFGTFCEEKEKPRYGLTTDIHTSNPLTITFHVWKETFVKASQASSWKAALNYFIKAPGWSHDGSSLTVKERSSKTEKEVCG